MTQGYYSGITGIQTHQYGLDVISDNLANVGTTGYKASTTEFADLFSKAIGNNTPTSNDIGYGVKLQATSFQMQQGALMPSDRFNDLALEGNGWFGVMTTNDKHYYTRDGSFAFDTFQQVAGDVNSASARLVTGDGMYVKGTMLTNFAYNSTFDYGDFDSNGTTGAYLITNPTNEAELTGANEQGILEFPTRLAYPVVPTTETSFFGNLGVQNETRTISSNVISAANDVNRLKLTFSMSATQPATGVAWDVVATVVSNDGSIVYDTKNGQAVFGESGALSSFDITSMNNDGTEVSVDLGTGYSGVISIDGVGTSGSSRSDGVSGGTLTKYGINANGVIIADFSNGRQSAIGRIAVYHFQNDQGLNREGGTYYQESADSGNPLFWTDANGNAISGAIVRSGNLEASNVRTDVGLTDMIIMQRAYQANSKIITTVDEMIQKALSMRR
ncbi:flagellar hook-basal body complex protein [Sulfuricurvum sp.]|uniref:flagellar hook-basal body complex protein n=1 Tax=Sulfuricurvum sp. TaxID=2025608 RepID=UPI00262D2F2A|nr:flagellar hook-basal body complex protein [Sulfuricurvum sp.]MDD2781836.1 flagellar hook-basal body complex protein [Sulfuricurvum sp.]